MDIYGKLIDDNTLRYQRLLPGPIDRVWEYLIDGEKRALWFAGGTMDQHAGGAVTFSFDHQRLSPTPDAPPEKYKEHAKGSTSEATVLEIVAPFRLIIEWEGIVHFELEEQGEAVLLTLTHERLTAERSGRIGVMAGWHTHLDILSDRLKEVDPPGFWGAHMKMEAEYGNMVD